MNEAAAITVLPTDVEPVKIICQKQMTKGIRNGTTTIDHGHQFLWECFRKAFSRHDRILMMHLKFDHGMVTRSQCTDQWTN